MDIKGDDYMVKPKKEKLWVNGMYRLDDDMGCHCCYHYYQNKCNTYGKRFDGGYCTKFIHKNSYNKPKVDKYELYMSTWN